MAIRKPAWILAVILLTSWCMGSAAGYTVEERRQHEYNNERERSAKTLEELDIVRNVEGRWDADDLITRRDMFKMVYIVKEEGSRQFPFADYTLEERIEQIDKVRAERVASGLPDVIFLDIEHISEDYVFAYYLYWKNLLMGRQEGGAIKAGFDDFATWNEALAVVSRLFTDRHYYGGIQFDGYWGSTPYFDFPFPYYTMAEEMNLINSYSMDVSSPRITEEQLDDPIEAYDFMHLLLRALYVPWIYFTGGPGLSVNQHYIEFFTEPKPVENDYEDIVD